MREEGKVSHMKCSSRWYYNGYSLNQFDGVPLYVDVATQLLVWELYNTRGTILEGSRGNYTKGAFTLMGREGR